MKNDILLPSKKFKNIMMDVDDSTQNKGNKIRQMFAKDKCRDIFRDIDNQHVGIKETKEYLQQYVQMKVQMNLKEINLRKLNTFIKTGMFGGKQYLQAVLRRIKLTKDLFILNLNSGKEIAIPYELSQKQLPMSFRYYHFILNYIQDNLGSDKKKYLQLSSMISKAFNENLSLKGLLKAPYMGNKKDKEEKQKYLHHIAQKAKNNNINHYTSIHAREVQYSNFVSLDGGNINEAEPEADE